ncbi:MAG: DNA translocase FtsK [Bacteroidia bacterium]|nr:DNA translocase FtsK [Bacteroidia bacterium]
MAKNTPHTPARKRKTPAKPASPGWMAQTLGWIFSLQSEGDSRDQVRKIVGWSLVFFCVVSLIACVSYFFTGHADQSVIGLPEAAEGEAETPVVSNWLGFAGAALADMMVRRGVGIFAFVVLIYGLLVGLVLLENDYYEALGRLLKYVAFITFFGSIFLSYIEILSGSVTFDLGGGFGYMANTWLFGFIGRIGVAFVLIFAMIVFAVVNFNAEIRASALLELVRTRKFSREMLTPGYWIRKVQPEPAPRTGARNRPADLRTAQPPARTPHPPADPLSPDLPARVPPTVPARQDEVRFEVLDPKTPAPPSQDRSITISARPGELPLEFTIVQPEEEGDLRLRGLQVEQLGEDNVGQIQGEDRLVKIIPEDDLEIENADEFVEGDVYDPTQELSDYQRPPFELLEDHGSGRGREVNREELETNKNKIVKTLEDYGIKIVSIKATIGPTVTLYEIVPAPGIRISKIKNLEDDIALSLAALGIRIIAPIPGKGTIGIEVPNSNPETVSLRGVLTTEKFIGSKAELPIALGRTISNEVFIADLHKMPHLLIAGATGQGKSVGLNTIIASLLYKKHPAEVKFVLIDPKKVEMNLYQALTSHYLAQLPEQGEDAIVTDVRDAVNVLKSLCIEMDQRYDLLKRARVRNLREYNTKFINRRLNPRKGHKFLPYIVLIIDELADMMMVAGKEVEMPIARLAQLARAVGIHLVVATQRPSVNVITGIIKANFPARLSYRVISKVDSRTILDANGADQLIGRGDMLLSTGNDLIRIQNAFIDTPEVERIVAFIGQQRGFPSPYYLPELPAEDGEDDGEDENETFERDALFDEAARLIVRFQIGSASLIQRKMKLGYNRAGRIIDQLEKAKIVGPYSGSKAREVLVRDESELERYLNTLT